VSTLPFVDHRRDPGAWAEELGISREAVDLYLASDVIDLHVDSFIWPRVFGYDLRLRHGPGALGARFYSQVDFPRALEANLAGATWVITTNPARDAESRRDTFLRNFGELLDLFGQVSEQFAVARTLAEYRQARSARKHAVFIGIQGGNALDYGSHALNLIDDRVVRITLVHLSSSSLGATSSPMKVGADRGLTDRGRDYVRQLNEKRIFVDLAHVSPRGFWDAVEVHDRAQPLLVTHTGVSGVFEHWRNIDDRQMRAIASSGGTIGVMYHSPFLGDSPLGGRAETIVRHLEHIVNTVGEDHASLGSDWDGAIVTPRDMPTCLELPRLVELMLNRGFRDTTITKILGQNFLRALGLLRGED
jgi:membrane dipeptidase